MRATPCATVTRRGLFDMQVCVPEDWCDAALLAFATQAQPSGTEAGWQLRHEMPERTPCRAHPGYVHVVLDA